MEMRLLGRSGLKVSALGFGAMTFGGNGFFKRIGQTDVSQATRLVDLCLEAGVNLFDTADIYSFGQAEEILGKAIGERRRSVLIATKAYMRVEKGVNDVGASRYHLVRACEASLRRLGTDYIDIYQLHGFDAITPLEETLRALDDLVRSGKVRYIGCSNYSGWHLMKSLAVSERLGVERMVSQQIYYSAAGREAEHELVPLGLDQGVGILVWGPLASGMLSGKFRRGAPDPEGARGSAPGGITAPDRERLYAVVECLDAIAQAHGGTIAQAALNYLLAKPGVTSVIIGARNEEQLQDNLGAARWQLTAEEVARVDEAGRQPLPYPYNHQARSGGERNPYWKMQGY
ncbi:MAG: aldo/keto reductase [Gammaproteobacteria bacterium]